MDWNTDAWDTRDEWGEDAEEERYQYDEDEDFFFVFHGMTPPTGKTLRELGLER